MADDRLFIRCAVCEEHHYIANFFGGVATFAASERMRKWFNHHIRECSAAGYLFEPAAALFKLGGEEHVKQSDLDEVDMLREERADTHDAAPRDHLMEKAARVGLGVVVTASDNPGRDLFRDSLVMLETAGPLLGDELRLCVRRMRAMYEALLECDEREIRASEERTDVTART